MRPISPRIATRSCLAILLALAALLPQAAFSQKTGKDIYGADVYWNATPNDVNNLLSQMKQQVEANFQMDIRT
ncbi:MAG: hypothetical protein ABIP20_01960, partial [Chthoniobacteraceae bacterium]